MTCVRMEKYCKLYMTINFGFSPCKTLQTEKQCSRMQKKAFTPDQLFPHAQENEERIKGLTNPCNDCLLSQEKLCITEAEVCGICFKLDNKENTPDIRWVSCSNCLMWVHTACAMPPVTSPRNIVLCYNT